jgi:hypothetical protein
MPRLRRRELETSGGVRLPSQNATSLEWLMLQINEERTKRLQLRLPRNELVAIEEFRFRARMPSRAAAVRELIRRGIGVLRRQTSISTSQRTRAR